MIEARRSTRPAAADARNLIAAGQFGDSQLWRGMASAGSLPATANPQKNDSIGNLKFTSKRPRQTVRSTNSSKEALAVDKKAATHKRVKTEPSGPCRGQLIKRYEKAASKGTSARQPAAAAKSTLEKVARSVPTHRSIKREGGCSLTHKAGEGSWMEHSVSLDQGRNSGARDCTIIRKVNSRALRALDESSEALSKERLADVMLDIAAQAEPTKAAFEYLSQLLHLKNVFGACVQDIQESPEGEQRYACAYRIASELIAVRHSIELVLLKPGTSTGRDPEESV